MCVEIAICWLKEKKKEKLAVSSLWREKRNIRYLCYADYGLCMYVFFFVGTVVVLYIYTCLGGDFVA
jgi:hypothetical protein